MNDASTPKKIALFQYSFIALPLAFAGLPLYMHMPDYYTREIGLSVGVIGTILLLIRAFDAIQDPILGYLSDRFHAQRHKLIVLAVFLLSIGICALCAGPYAYISAALWFALAMVVASTGFSLLTINLNMVGGLWHDDHNQRTRISAWREFFSLIGLLCAAILPPLLLLSFSANISFLLFFGLFALLMAISTPLFLHFLTYSYDALDHQFEGNKKPQFKFALWSILKGHMRGFFFVCFLAHLAAAFPAVLFLFFVQDYLQAQQYSGLFLFIYFLSGAALMAVWVKLSARIGKETAWIISMLLSIISFIGALFLNEGDFIAFGIICLLSGTALGADLALPPALLADKISNVQKQSEANQHYAVLAFIPKMSLALASGIAFITLGYFGFSAGAKNTVSSLQVLALCYALVPCIIKFIAIIFLWRSIQNKGEHHENNERSSADGHIKFS
ncbi:MAG: MFS transporter [Alphaproteobacteria bacterium]|nr:MFS transporter [Alphaproteobacteria bacterium]